VLNFIPVMLVDVGIEVNKLKELFDDLIVLI